MTNGLNSIGWLGVARLGLVQACLGSIVVMTTSTLNRVMVVELALPAMLPGALVAIHYAMQLLRPRMGYGSDVGGRRTPWIVGGMGVLALGGVGAAAATAWMHSAMVPGFLLAVASFIAIGIGVSAAGTSLLVLLAKRVDEDRRAAAATIVWIMMIAGFAVTATGAGHVLDPYTPERLVAVMAAVASLAFVVSVLAVRGVEPTSGGVAQGAGTRAVEKAAFLQALAEVWAEASARRFTIFVFLSMIAYSAQDLILEPFAGIVFGFSPGETTRLSGVQHGGVLTGMILVAVAGSGPLRRWTGSLKLWTVLGCVASAAALAALAVAGTVGGSPGGAWPVSANVFLLGAANGAFSIAAIGLMMAMAGQGRESREGVRMGLWGASQAIAFAVGGFAGAAMADAVRQVVDTQGVAYATVFAVESVMFIAAALLASTIGDAGGRLKGESTQQGAGAAPLAVDTGR